MNIFVRTVWSDYEKITLEEFNYRINSFYDIYFVVDELDNNCIYLLERHNEED